MSKLRMPYKRQINLERANQVISSPAVMDQSNADARIIRLLHERTMADSNHILNLLTLVEHLIENSILGCYVECGVWRGGSILTRAYKMLSLSLNVSAEIWAFDTFQGTPRTPIQNCFTSSGVSMHNKTEV